MPAALVIALYLLFATGSVLNLARARANTNLRHCMPQLLLAGIGTAIYFIGPTIHGLEYEDAYVHIAAADFQLRHFVDGTDGFYVNACMAGSNLECIIAGSYATQLIGYSVLIRLGAELLGDTTSVANLVSLCASLLTVQITWILLQKYVETQVGRIVAIGLLLSAPAFHAISGSTFAEPLFAFFCITHFYFYLELSNRRPSRRPPILISLLFISSGALMIVAKKEGVLLVGLLLLFSLVTQFQTWWAAYQRATNAQFVILLSVALILYAVILLRVEDADIHHSNDIGHPAFALSYATALLPTLFLAGVSIKYFGLIGILTIACGIPAAIFSRSRIALMATTVVCAFVFLYSIHARHRFFVNGATVNPAEMVRYLYALLPFSCLAVGISVSRISAAMPTRYMHPPMAIRWIATAATVGILACCYEARALRLDMAGDELDRLGPVADLIGSDTTATIISPFSAALMPVAGEHLTIVDASVAMVPEVRNSITKAAERGERIFIDRKLCELPEDDSWKTLCRYIHDL